jgi:hypothetical protein
MAALHKPRIRLCAAYVTLLFYVAATSSGFAVSHFCCVNHSHLDRAIESRSTSYCCVHGDEHAAEHSDSREHHLLGTMTGCCFGVFHVARHCGEHTTRGQRPDSRPSGSALGVCGGSVGVDRIQLCLNLHQFSGLDYYPLPAAPRTMPLLI